MFSPEPWARAFLRGLAAEESESAFEVLKLYCHAGLMIPGEVTGLNGARRFAPIIDRALKQAGLTGVRAAAYARNFFLLMIRRGCLYQYKKIVARIQNNIDQNNGTVRAALETPFEAEPEFIELVKQSLLKKTNARDIRLRSCLFPELVGGFRIRMGSVLLDGSLSTRLAKMASDLGAAPGTEFHIR
jgi:F-type H+-transporting ATPase subunit delta